MTQRISLFFVFAVRYQIGLLRSGLTLAVCLLFNDGAFAQSTAQCPGNMGFEDGTFANWKAYSGTVSVNRSVNPPAQAYALFETGPSYDQHTIIPKGTSVDEFGEFPLNSPNGSNYVIKLGNSTGGHGAERLSYTLDVPANVNSYSIIFNYAVVLQNPNHQAYEQPKFNVQIIDETTSNTTS